MSHRRLMPVDAQTWWMSAKIPNDQFLLYGFAGVPAVEDALDAVRERARACPDLTLRIDDRATLAYPAWVPGGVSDTQLVVHDLDDATWAGCLAAVRRLADDQLDPRTAGWRLHVFAGLDGVPGVDGAGSVAIVQVSHVLGDGIRSSALAARLFGRTDPVPRPHGRRVGAWALPALGVRAALAHRRLMRETEAGAVPERAVTRPLLRTNERTSGPRGIRTVMCRRSDLAGNTVTVAVLAAVSIALAGHLRDLGDDPSTLGAEVPMARAGARRANNHYGNVGIGLHPDDPERASRIAAELEARRRRVGHPAVMASDRASAAVPAPLLRWGVGKFDPEVRPSSVSGNTVVSSVDRGAADLAFGGAPVVVTAGYPALSPLMGLTHGVHGIGDTIAVSVHAAESAVGGPGGLDAYVARLAGALNSGADRR